MNRSFKIEYKLLLEGIEIPCVNAQIQFMVNQSSEGIFDLVPLREIYDIKPRTLVTFMVQNKYFDSDKKTISSDFVIAFEGEVYAHQMNATAEGTKTFQIRCLGLCNYLDIAKVYFLDASRNGNEFGELVAANDAGISSKGTALGINGYLNKVIKDSISANGTDLTKAVTSIIENIGAINTFFSVNEERYSLQDRFKAASVPKLNDLIDSKLISDNFISNIIGTSSGTATLRDIINTLLGIIFHNISTIPCPSFKASDDGLSINQFAIMPDAFMLAPPKCNVVFPHQISMQSMQRNFFSEITRISVSSGDPINTGSDVAAFQRFFAPSFLEYFNTGKESIKFPSSATNTTGAIAKITSEGKSEGNPQTKNIMDFMVMSLEELSKGIFPERIDSLPPALSLFIASNSAGNAEDMYRVMTQIAYYLYFQKRFIKRTANFHGNLNLNVVPGAPILFVDENSSEQNIIANLDGVIHSFSGSGSATTQYIVSYARHIEEYDDYDSTQYCKVPIPVWFGDELGKNEDIKNVDFGKFKSRIKNMSGVVSTFGSGLDKYYQNLFMCNAITNKSFSTIQGAVWKLIESYKNTEDKIGFADNYNSRSMLSYSQWKAFMRDMDSYKGAGNAQESLNYILSERKRVIQEYANRLNNNVSFSPKSAYENKAKKPPSPPNGTLARGKTFESKRINNSTNFNSSATFQSGPVNLPTPSNKKVGNIPQDSINLIKQEEGCKLKAYWDTYGKVWTVGWGNTYINNKRVTPSTTLSKQQAEDLLVEHIDKEIMPCLEKFISKNKVNLTDRQKSALISAGYNGGMESLLRSNVGECLKQGDIRGAGEALKRWKITAKGQPCSVLRKRRIREAAMLCENINAA